MLNQIQPNAWSCLPTAFATATHLKTKRLIEAIGHDGSQIVFPELPEPLCRRAFHPQECIKALIALGSKESFVTISREVTCIGSEKHSYTLIEQDDVFDTLMQKFSGVIVGHINEKLHAAAWNSNEQKAYDPCGFIYPKDKYRILEFYMLANLI